MFISSNFIRFVLEKSFKIWIIDVLSIYIMIVKMYTDLNLPIYI